MNCWFVLIESDRWIVNILFVGDSLSSSSLCFKREDLLVSMVQVAAKWKRNRGAVSMKCAGWWPIPKDKGKRGEEG